MKLLTSIVQLFEFLKNYGFPFSNYFQMREALQNFRFLGEKEKEKRKKNQRIAAPGFYF
jgi:hypothetical protein